MAWHGYTVSMCMDHTINLKISGAFQRVSVLILPSLPHFLTNFAQPIDRGVRPLLLLHGIVAMYDRMPVFKLLGT